MRHATLSMAYEWESWDAQIVGRVQVGALPVHGYSIPQLSQFWAHSDINGTFYVINVTNINATAATVSVRLYSPILPFCCPCVSAPQTTCLMCRLTGMGELCCCVHAKE